VGQNVIDLNNSRSDNGVAVKPNGKNGEKPSNGHCAYNRAVHFSSTHFLRESLSRKVDDLIKLQKKVMEDLDLVIGKL